MRPKIDYPKQRSLGDLPKPKAIGLSTEAESSTQIDSEQCSRPASTALKRIVLMRRLHELKH